MVIILSTLLTLTSRLSEANDQLLLWINGLASRSWLFDSVVAFFQDNDLAKAGVIGCCFLAAWYGGKSSNSTDARRRILITTLIAAVFVITTTKVLSHTIFLPRPEIQAQKIYRLEGDQLVEMKRIPSDLGSFPSAHAGFFIVISLGIWLASRRLGWLALGWTFFVVLAGKMIGGHRHFATFYLIRGNCKCGWLKTARASLRAPGTITIFARCG